MFGRAIAVILLGLVGLGGCQPDQQPVSQDALVGGVDLSGTICEQAYAKLQFCRPDVHVVVDRDAFVSTCNALVERAANGLDEGLIDDARVCFDHYTCASYEQCLEGSALEAIRGDELEDAAHTVASLGDPSSATDQHLLEAERACSTLNQAREFERARAECETIFEVGLARLSVHDDEYHCYALEWLAKGLDAQAQTRVARGCEDLRARKREGESLTKLREHTDALEWDEGLSVCEYRLKAPRSTNADAACRAHAQALFDAKREVVSSAFEPGSELMPHAQKRVVDRDCDDLERAAKQLGQEIAGQTKQLCAAARIAPEVHASLAELEAGSLGESELRLECGSIERSLDGVEGEWATSQRDRWFEICVVARARMLFPKTIPNMRSYCSWEVKDLVAELRARDHHDPDLDPWLEKAAPICERKDE